MFVCVVSSSQPSSGDLLYAKCLCVLSHHLSQVVEICYILMHTLSFGGLMAIQLLKVQKLKNFSLNSVYPNLSQSQQILNLTGIDLVVTEQPNIILDSGTRTSLDSSSPNSLL